MKMYILITILMSEGKRELPPAWL